MSNIKGDHVFVEGVEYACDTDTETEAAKEAMREAGVVRARIYRGDGEDEIATSLYLYA